MNTEEFVAEERRMDRVHRTGRIAMMLGAVLMALFFLTAYRCTVDTADEDVLVEEARARRVEAEQATIRAREAAEAAVMPERDRLRYEAHERCLQQKEPTHCDELYFPESRRKNLVQDLYRECLNANIEDWHCDEEVEDLIESYDRR